MLLQTYRRKARTTALFTELRNLSDLSELQPILEKNGFVYEEHLNYLIDLNRPSDEILQSVGRSTRKKIRKTLRDNLVQIIEVKNRVELEPCYETLQKTFSRAKVPLADYSLFAAACEELSPKGMARSLLAKVEGVIAACSIELAYKDVIYGWYGGSDRAYRRISLNEILIWHVLKWGADGDYRLYDFGGAGKPDEKYGVRDFKAKFGGKLVCFGRNRWVHYPALLRLSELGYYIYRCCLKQSQWLCRKRTDA
jgi:lipid II:glycine glycyltransferase (peptidoglycan interpeptide bridge formation enzyme)